MRKTPILLIFACILLAGCATKVSRISSDKKVDLSGNWNDTDITIVTKALVDDCLDGAWLKEWKHAEDKPTVLIGTVQNRTDEHIDTSIIATKLEAALVESGKVSAVNDMGNRSDIASEREWQQENASPETAKQHGKEIGADYMIQGSVKIATDREGNTSTRTYYVDLELVDIETGEKVWMGEKDVRKLIQRNHYKY